MTFRTNAAQPPLGHIRIAVPRILGIVCSPSSVLFDQSPAGTEQLRVVEVRNIGTTPARITSVTATAGLLEAKLLPADPAPDSDVIRVGRVVVKLLPRPPGAVGGSVLIRVRTDAGEREITLAVSANSCDPVTATPAFAALPRASGGGQVMSFTCAVRGATNQPLTVRPKDLPPGFRAEVTDPETAAPVEYVRVTWEPPAPADDRAAYPSNVTLGSVSVCRLRHRRAMPQAAN